MSSTNKGHFRYLLLLATAALSAGLSYRTRRWRDRQLDQWLSDYPHNIQEQFPPGRNIDNLILLLKRTGLMGQTAQSVKDELPRIREFHQEHGLKGTLTVREYGPSNRNAREEEQEMTFSTYWTMFQDFVDDPLEFARRECYYLYTEKESRGVFRSGKVHHELFCRGTTLVVDLLACLQFWHAYDEDLDCHLHLGFLNHADRIVEDVIPLLGPPRDHVTVEISGHSLGGAVAAIVAAKLKRLGYDVIRVTSIGTPRLCKTPKDAAKLAFWLPVDSLRVEQDVDFAPFCLPHAHHPCGNKLWLLTKRDQTAYISNQAPINSDENCAHGGTTSGGKCPPSWVDNIWVNMLVPELIMARGIPHR